MKKSASDFKKAWLWLAPNPRVLSFLSNENEKLCTWFMGTFSEVLEVTITSKQLSSILFKSSKRLLTRAA